MFDETDRWFEIAKELKDNGFEVFIAGGAVRDILSNRIPSDFDLTTNARPEDLLKLFPSSFNAGTQFRTTMIDHVEVSSYRGDTIIEDLSKRDLTINALAMDPFTGVILDPFNGRAHLHNKVVKMVEDPFARIAEDPLRILRAFRFATWFGPDFHIDRKTSIAIHYGSHRLKTVAKERFPKEIRSALVARQPSVFFKLLLDFNLLKDVFGFMIRTVDCGGGKYHAETVWQHSLDCVDNLVGCTPEVILAGFLHDIGKPLVKEINEDGSFIGHEIEGCRLVEEVLYNIKFPGETVDFVSDCIKFHMHPVDSLLRKKGIRRFLRRVDVEGKSENFSIYVLLALKRADSKANRAKIFDSEEVSERHGKIIETYLQVIEEEQAFKIKDLDINGSDIMDEFGIEPGPVIGKILNGLLEIVIDNPEKNVYNELLVEATKILG